MAVAPSAIRETLGERDELQLISCVRVSNAVAHFAQSLPFRVRCSNDLDLGWRGRRAKLRCATASSHPTRRVGRRHCASTSTVRAIDSRMPDPATVRVRQPTGAMRRSPSQLRRRQPDQRSRALRLPAAGLDSGRRSRPPQLAAVRYFAAIERAYTRALHADAGLCRTGPA